MDSTASNDQAGEVREGVAKGTQQPWLCCHTSARKGTSGPTWSPLKRKRKQGDALRRNPRGAFPPVARKDGRGRCSPPAGASPSANLQELWRTWPPPCSMCPPGIQSPPATPQTLAGDLSCPHCNTEPPLVWLAPTPAPSPDHLHPLQHQDAGHSSPKLTCTPTSAPLLSAPLPKASPLPSLGSSSSSIHMRTISPSAFPP